MVDFNYALDKYSIKNALFWGNCKKHIEKASGDPERKVGHLFIAVMEGIPVFGQVASLLEYAIVAGFQKPKAPLEVNVTIPPEAEEFFKALFKESLYPIEGLPICREEDVQREKMVDPVMKGMKGNEPFIAIRCEHKGIEDILLIRISPERIFISSSSSTFSCQFKPDENFSDEQKRNFLFVRTLLRTGKSRKDQEIWQISR